MEASLPLSEIKEREYRRPCKTTRPHVIKRRPVACACGEHAFVRATRGFVIIFDVGDMGLVGQRSWQARLSTSPGRAYVKISTSFGSTTTSLGRFILNPPSECYVDHISGNELDFRRLNLRIANAKTNAQNRRGITGSRFPYKGIEHDARCTSRPWRARIKKTFLGNFSTMEEAARAYDRAARSLFGEFAKLNFPDEQAA